MTYTCSEYSLFQWRMMTYSAPSCQNRDRIDGHMAHRQFRDLPRMRKDRWYSDRVEVRHLCRTLLRDGWVAIVRDRNRRKITWDDNFHTKSPFFCLMLTRFWNLFSLLEKEGGAGLLNAKASSRRNQSYDRIACCSINRPSHGPKPWTRIQNLVWPDRDTNNIQI